MKRFAAMILAAAMLLTGAFAMAEGKTVNPTHTINMADYGKSDSTVDVYFEADNMEGTKLVYDVYEKDLYNVDDIKVLQPGDKLVANGETVTVKEVKQDGDGFEINGGFDNQGVSLWLDDNTHMLVSVQYSDAEAKTNLGTAKVELADMVHIKTFKMGEDGNFHDEYDDVTLPKFEVKAYLQNLMNEKPDDPDFMPLAVGPENTTVTLKDGKVVEILVDYSPNA